MRLVVVCCALLTLPSTLLDAGAAHAWRPLRALSKNGASRGARFARTRQVVREVAIRVAMVGGGLLLVKGGLAQLQAGDSVSFHLMGGAGATLILNAFRLKRMSKGSLGTAAASSLAVAAGLGLMNMEGSELLGMAGGGLGMAGTIGNISGATDRVWHAVERMDEQVRRGREIRRARSAPPLGP